jgi:glycosyltransferase 2 family protein
MPDTGQTLRHTSVEPLDRKGSRSVARRLLKIALHVFIMAALLLLLLRLVDIPALLTAYQRADFHMLPMVIALLAAAIVSRTVRLWILTGRRSAFLPVFHAHNVGIAVNNLLPLRAGEVITALLLGRIGGVSASSALSIIAIDRILDVVVLLILYAGLLLLVPELVGNIRHADAALIALVVMVLGVMWFAQARRDVVRSWAVKPISLMGIARRERWEKRLDGILGGLGVLAEPRTMLAAVAWSPVGWILSVVACFLVLRGFWPEAPLKASVLAVCLSALSVTIVTVPAGIGVMHASLFFSVTLFGLDPENALLFGITYHAAIVIVSTLLGLIGLRPAGLGAGELAARLRGQGG